MERITLPRYWINAGEKGADDRGNEIAPQQIPSSKTVTKALYDSSGAYDSPFMFYFEAGYHEIKISNPTQAVNIIKVEITAPEQLPAYDEIKQVYKEKGYQNYSGETLTIEGEGALYKSSSSLIPKADRSSAKLSPSSPTSDVLNYIGGSSWQNYGEELIWQVDVPKSGLYKLSFAYIQNTVINGISYRELKINGKIPFKEAKNLRFEYDTNWNYYEFNSPSGEPYLIYLEEGLQEISLTVTLGMSRANEATPSWLLLKTWTAY